MMHYVLCHARPLWHIAFQQTLVVLKKRPDWQAGRYNLPGGKIEEGETPQDAARRELREETGVESDPPRVLGQVFGNDYTMYVCDCPYPGYVRHPFIPHPFAPTDEPASWLDLEVVLTSPLVLPSLRLLVPLCRARAEGWTIYDHGSQSEFRIDL